MTELTKSEMTPRAPNRFLNGTHSKDIAAVDVIDETVGSRNTCRCNGMALYRLQDGLIVETRLHINELMLPCRIGVIPARAA